MLGSVLLSGLMVGGGLTAAITPASAADDNGVCSPGKYYAIGEHARWADDARTDRAHFADIYEFDVVSEAYPVETITRGMSFIDPHAQLVATLPVPALGPDAPDGVRLMPDALGTSPEGRFYYAVSENRPNALREVRGLNVYSYAPGEAGPTLVEEGMSLISPTAELISAGAYNTKTQEYYFAYYTRQEPGQGGALAHAVRVHLYRVSEPNSGHGRDAALAETSTGEVTHVDIPVREDLLMTSEDRATLREAGDIAFDSAGNLFMHLADDATSVGAYKISGTLLATGFEPLNGVSDPAEVGTVPLAQADFSRSPDEFTVTYLPKINGFGYTANGELLSSSAPTADGSTLSSSDFENHLHAYSGQAVLPRIPGALVQPSHLNDGATCSTPTTLELEVAFKDGVRPASAERAGLTYYTIDEEAPTEIALSTEIDHAPASRGPFPLATFSTEFDRSVRFSTGIGPASGGSLSADQYELTVSCTIVGQQEPFYVKQGTEAVDVQHAVHLPKAIGIIGHQVTCNALYALPKQDPGPEEGDGGDNNGENIDGGDGDNGDGSDSGDNDVRDESESDAGSSGRASALSMSGAAPTPFLWGGSAAMVAAGIALLGAGIVPRTRQAPRG